MRSTLQKALAWAGRNPFLRLVQLFSQRAVGSGSTGDVDLGIGGGLALLATPGAFTSLYLLNKYSSLLQWLRGVPGFNPYVICIPDEYFFIVYSMAITGLVVLLRWEYLLPGRTDFMNLAPLPLKLRDIFLANVAALSGLAILFAIDVNAVSSIFFPLFVTMKIDTFRSFILFVVAHTTAVLGISAFTFLALLALQALLMSLLPETIYRRVSLVVRTVLLVFFFAILLSSFVYPISTVNIRPASTPAANWWPPIWFLSLFESQIDALRARAAFDAGRALWAMAAAAGLAALGFSLSYRRYFLRIPERQEGPGNPSRVSLQVRWLGKISRLWLHPGTETACYGFLLKTLGRSESHMVFLGLWSGIGLLIALQDLSTGTLGQTADADSVRQALMAPLTLGFAIIAGLRFVFDIPAAIEANWIFRLAAQTHARALRSACRKVLLTFLLPWLLLLWIPFAVSRWGWADATLIGVMDLCLMAAGVELALSHFSKIPFTCTFSASRDHLLKVVLGCCLILVFVIPLLAGVEERILAHPARIATLIAFSLAIVVFVRRREAATSGAPMFEDKGEPQFALLHLSGD